MVSALSAPASAEAVAALLAALAILCWPAHPASARLAIVLASRVGARRAIPAWSRTLLGRLGPAGRAMAVVLAAALLGAGVGGWGGSVAAAMAAGLGTHRRRGAGSGRRRSAELAALLDAVGVLAAELRAGAHPATAAASAAASAAPAPLTRRGTGPSARLSGPVRRSGNRSGAAVVHRVLRSVAAGARLGARVPVLLEQHARTEPAIADELRRLAAAWAVAERHGIALADLADAVRTDLDARARLAGQVKAQLAGPRSTAAVLAGLPLLGVLLGQGIGANPWRVLTDTSAGQILLVVGTALACAGVAWSGQITARAVPR